MPENDDFYSNDPKIVRKTLSLNQIVRFYYMIKMRKIRKELLKKLQKKCIEI